MAPRLKKSLALIFVLLFFCALIAGGTLLWALQAFQNPGPLQQTKLLTIESGSGVRAISAVLEQSGVIHNRFVFVAAAKYLNTQSELKAGEYEFPPAISMAAVMEKLVKGDVVIRRFTIPEGLTGHQIITILKNTPDMSGDLAGPLPPEGALLPGTYDYKYQENRTEALKRLSEAMQKTLVELWDKRQNDLPLRSMQEALTLASIVEKETGTPEERAKVAGVFINRLKSGMPLQSDPTVIYALTGGKPENEGLGPLGRRLLKKDLELDSPYNTYKYPGLPPGPICNPGIDAIKATLQPEAHDYLYFVADGTGGHAFARTLEEHNQNVAKWREVRRAHN